ncbi:DUF3284 domain-containing protein [Oceanivirga salmonicida]|uniref:DUF3284 domain-containing protein n=1 Tax=Oceanivirga salmonicida TaxID=1769291 RepID=UPI00082CF867|nr:DUF3284 domain-containing protein [Oceanivirga salmonicida]
MKLEYILNVSDKEIYNFLINNLKSEINVNKELKEGLKVKKNINSKNTALLEILKLDENKRYSLKYITNLGETIVDYSIDKLDENKVKVIYEETYITDSVIKKSNYYLVGLFYSYLFKRKRKKQFKMIEKYIVENRDKI